MTPKLLAPLLSLTFATCAFAANYSVGPGQPLKSIAEVPWATLAPGDQVNIHWRSEPYKEKWVIGRRGTPAKPIIIKGIPGPGGELPMIDGNDGVTVNSLSYTGEQRSVIKIGSSNIPADCLPANIVIENLDISGANPTSSFQGVKGVGKYLPFASGIWIEKGENIVIRGCAIHDNANGFFVSHGASNVLMERCDIFGNGIVKNMYDHNVYTEARGMVFQFNHFGPLRAGAIGNNLKDRSSGLVVRNNWIEGGNREIQIVDSDDAAAIRDDPAYQRTVVSGNMIIEPAGDGGGQIVCYGGDSGKLAQYRKGTLLFEHNTVISKRKDATTLFRMMTNDERLEARNNVFYTVSRGKSLALLDSVGEVELGGNWIKQGWVNAHSKFTGGIHVGSGNVEGDAPQFVNSEAGDYRLVPGSTQGAALVLSQKGGFTRVEEAK